MYCQTEKTFNWKLELLFQYIRDFDNTKITPKPPTSLTKEISRLIRLFEKTINSQEFRINQKIAENFQKFKRRSQTYFQFVFSSHI